MVDQKSTLIVGIDGRGAVSGGKQVKGAVDGMSNKVKDADKKLKSFKSAVKGAFFFGAAVVAIRAVTRALSGMLRNVAEQEDTIAQLNAGLRSTNSISGQTVESIRATSAEMQQLTRFSNEAVEEIAGIGLSFTNITGEVFPRFLEISADVATRMGTDLRSTAVQLAKALNDPVQNLGALSRSGIQFSKEQKELIQGLVRTNRTMDAQKVILAELERQYAGSAEAARDTLGGALDGLRNNFDELSEAIATSFSGEIRTSIELLNDLALAATKVVEKRPGVNFGDVIVGGSLADITSRIGSAFGKIQKDAEELSKAVIGIGATTTGAGGLGSRGDTFEKVFPVESIENFSTAMETQIKVFANQRAEMGMTAEQVKIFRAEQKLAADATKFLDKAIEKYNLTLAEQEVITSIVNSVRDGALDKIQQEIELMAEARRKTEAVILSQKDFASVLSNNFADAILGAKTLNSALSDIANQLIRMAVQRAIFNAIAGPSLGSANGNAFVPKMAGGGGAGFIPGPTTSRVGERGAEVVMPLVRNDRGQLGVGGGDSGGGGDTIMNFIGDNTDTKRSMLTDPKFLLIANQRIKAGFPF